MTKTPGTDVSGKGEHASGDELAVFGLKKSNPIVQALIKVGTCLRLTGSTAVIADDGTPETFIKGGSEALVHQSRNPSCELVVMKLPSFSSTISRPQGIDCVPASEIVNVLAMPNTRRTSTSKLEELVLALYREAFLTSPKKGV